MKYLLIIDYLNAIDELLNECKILYKKVSTQKKHILSLEEKIDIIEKYFQIEKQNFLKKEKQNLTCKECESFSFQIVQLQKVLERYEKGQIGLNDVLRKQRFSNDKSGLGYSKFNKPCTSKTIFVKASDQSNKEKVNKAQKVHYYHKRKRFVKNKSYTPRYRSTFVPT